MTEDTILRELVRQSQERGVLTGRMQELVARMEARDGSPQRREENGSEPTPAPVAAVRSLFPWCLPKRTFRGRLWPAAWTEP